LLVLSALPYVVVSQYLSLARVKRDIRALIVVQLLLCVIVLGLSMALMEPMGITSVGVAWLAGQGIVALVLLLTRMRSMWMMQLNTQPAVRVVTRLRRMGHRVTRNSDAQDMRMLLQAARPMIQPLPGVPAPATWQIQHVLNTVNDVRVALIGPARQEPVALLKMANTPQASESLQHRLRVGDILWNDPRLAEWRQVLPAVLANGHAGGHDFVVKQRLPGVDLRQLANAPRAFAEGQWAATGSITDLHQLTGRRLHADEDHVGRWVHAPALVLRQFSQAHLQGGQYTRTVDRLAGNLNDALLGRAF
jgi:hypothetical protein